MSKTRYSKETLQARYTTAMAGIQKHATSSINLAGTTYTAATLIQPFQSWLSAVATGMAAEAQYHAAVVTEQALAKTCQTLWQLLVAYVRINYGSDLSTLSDFGVAPVKRTPESAATKAAAAVKAAATRKARGTMSAKQKAKITGSTPATPPVSDPPAVRRAEFAGDRGGGASPCA